MAPDKPGFLEELKQRHVVRAAIIYAAAVWALAQGISQLSPAFDLSTGVTFWFVIACVIGFPFWIAFAWYFKFTAHGIEREDEAMVDAAALRRTGRHLDYWIIGILAVAVVLLLTNQLVLQRGKTIREFAAAPTTAAKSAVKALAAATSVRVASMASPFAAPILAKSVAVLPFENLSADKDNAYFADGIQDLILTKLADIGDLKVIARTSTQSYGTHPGNLAKIGKQLGVATFLEGSVQKAGNQVLINVQLIDARTDSHIWAQSYQRTLNNIFGVEGEVAEKVAESLNAKLTQAEAARVGAIPTTNAAAYDAYLRGEYHMTAFNHGEMKPDVAAAVRDYSEAVRQDPGFALAWARLANAQVFLGAMNNGDPGLASELYAGAKISIGKAMALQPDLAEAWVSQGIADIWPALKLQAALNAFQKAHTLQPQNANALWYIAFTRRTLGETEESIRALQQLQVIDPLRALTMLGGEQAYLHHFADAEQTMKRALAINPDSWVMLDSLARLYAYLGDLPAMGRLIDSASTSIKANPNFVDTVGQYLLYRRDWDAARKLYAQAKEPQNAYAAFYPVEIKRGDVEWYAGNRAAAREQYRRAIPLLQKMLQQGRNPKTPSWHAELGWVYARLGHNSEALQQGRLAMKLIEPAMRRVREGSVSALTLARIEAQVGEASQAVVVLDQLLASPRGTLVSVPLLKLNPTWDPIRHDPAFQALLKKYSGSQATPATASTSAAYAPQTH